MSKILVAEDDTHMQEALRASLEMSGHEVVIVGDGSRALAALKENHFDVIITDQQMPIMTGLELLDALVAEKSQTPCIMITAYGTVNQAVDAMQRGAADFIMKPFDTDELERIIERVLSPETKEFRSQGAKRGSKGKAIITNDSYMIRVLEVAEAVAKSDATVLVQGESGTGKELIARLIHQASPRSNQAFVAVNCAALPANLLESELFGHEKGAFTGALTRKLGKFELAHGGTILLDEISEMELPLQAKLLRVLQEREVDRVGGASPISIDVRVVATTNRNLEEEARAGRFRSDLYYRLNVIPLTLPPLRKRQCDIPLLIEHFLRSTLGKDAPKLDGSLMEYLKNYPWPGNIRELQNAVERAAILSRGKAPRQQDFLLHPENHTTRVVEVLEDLNTTASLSSQIEKETIPTHDSHSGSVSVIRSGMTVAEMEKALIFETLRATHDNRTKAAELLGISIRTLRNKLAEYRGESVE